jgi:hypothetical protein
VCVCVLRGSRGKEGEREGGLFVSPCYCSTCSGLMLSQVTVRAMTCFWLVKALCSALKLQSLPASTRCCYTTCLCVCAEIGKKIGVCAEKQNLKIKPQPINAKNAPTLALAPVFSFFCTGKKKASLVLASLSFSPLALIPLIVPPSFLSFGSVRVHLIPESRSGLGRYASCESDYDRTVYFFLNRPMYIFFIIASVIRPHLYI